MIFAGYSNSILLFNKELVRTMVQKGHRVICVGPETGYDNEFKKIGATFIQVPFNRYSTNPFTGLRIIKQIKKIIKNEKINIYYGFQAIPITYGIYAAKKAKCPNIYASLTGAGKIAQNRNGLYNKLIRHTLSFLMKKTLKECKKVFFLNKDDLSYFICHKIVKETQCVKVNGSGVNIERFAQKPLPQKDHFLFIGSLLRLKGIVEYMEAAKIIKHNYKDSTFTVVGAIDQRLSAITKEELDKYINEGVIDYKGYQKDVRPYLEKCSVFVLPSYSEGIPTCVLEAMSVGRPIITTNATGCKETVKNGVNGYKVKVGSIEELAEKMAWFIEHKKEAKKMANNSRKMAEHIFNVDIVNNIMMKEMNI